MDTRSTRTLLLLRPGAYTVIRAAQPLLYYSHTLRRWDSVFSMPVKVLDTRTTNRIDSVASARTVSQ